jgi:hypothetical protein
MKNISVQLPFDSEKLEALRLALEAKDIFLEDEVEQFLNGLYKRTVHKEVQMYLDSKAANAPKAKKAKTAVTE